MTTESDLWNRLKPQFIKAGALPIRLENAANMSVPDVALITRLRTVWVELKIVHGNYVYLPKFQFAFGSLLASRANRALFWMITDREKSFRGEDRYGCWKYRDLIDYAEEGDNESVKIRLSTEKRKDLSDVLDTIRKGT